ncbi:MAG: CoA transferase [Oceanospirillaceae bacterium]|uniref:CaiB/BaiF CoA transferase family protein n=1 Tax=unclassified Thalassolituus TaxID=2624967 RepID=UPI000C4A355F|nr:MULTISPECIES: CaiB/BaiF CoA-transferase family protein [unclassified Thalassolituus]MAS26547.1 CoA transferase [Oceanospirillaceae bacterium]MAY01013.1 CoA transferase [Oceanospirillaceae bacterium]MBL34628.1 CoA transferase [Oceanospirillaceae bacterium]MBS52502.1 CoA transferase [Oceanospirillaceae bacterium]|tara:strand:- start:724 stop:1938 length:1215 start_codon:yes stop_codon:yes gene_type:complete
MTKPLTGIRVLDLSRILAGPWCSQHLADMGAEVIKIEHPQRGDDTRGWGPPFIEDTGESAYFLCANRGKKSVAIDIASSEGQALIRKLAAESDVVLENFKVGGLAKYGLDFDSLKQVNPDIIYCSITGFGQSGPYAPRTGYDFLIQGMGGLMGITGKADSEVGGGPVKTGVAVTDLFTGMYAASSVLSALLDRERNGAKAVHIDLSLLDVQVATLANQALNYLTSGVSPTRLGNSHPNIVPYQAFATADGHIILAVGNDSQFEKFCDVANASELLASGLYTTNRQRVEQRAQLVPLLEAIVRQQPSEFWLSELKKAGVPCGPINSIEQVFDDPQVKHRGTQLTMERGQASSIDLVSNPVRMNEQAMNADSAPPQLGEHTRDVLSELLHEDPQTLDALRDKGVIR